MKKPKPVMKVWRVSFEFEDDGGEGGYFTHKELVILVKCAHMVGLKIKHLVVLEK